MEHVNKVVDSDFAKTASENAKIDIEVEKNRYGIRIISLNKKYR